MQRLNRDGVKLCFEEAGSGDPPILLVHGWTCDHTYMTPQFEYFRSAHRAVAVDLRGHGQSDKPQQDYTMKAFNDLAWLCSQLGVQKPVVIGHSMGGVIAVELARSFPEVPAAVVTLDSPLVPLKLYSIVLLRCDRRYGGRVIERCSNNLLQIFVSPYRRSPAKSPDC